MGESMFLKLTKRCGTVALVNMSRVNQVCRDDGDDYTTLHYEDRVLVNGGGLDPIIDHIELRVLESMEEIAAGLMQN